MIPWLVCDVQVMVAMVTRSVISSREQAWFPVLYYGSNRFGRVEPPRTHEKLSYDPCSLWSWMVNRGSVGLYHSELMSSSTAGLGSCVVLWFEHVQKSSTTPNSWEIILWSLFPLELSGSRRFGWVEPPWTHEKLPYGPCSLWFEEVIHLPCNKVARAGSVRLNHPELMSNSAAGMVTCVVLWFEQVRKSWTTLNSWEIILWSLFPLELSGSRKFGKAQLPELMWNSAWFPVFFHGSKGLNHAKLMSSSTTGLVSCVVLWFEQVRKSWTTPNSCQAPFPNPFEPLYYRWKTLLAMAGSEHE